MYCKICGKEIPENAENCTSCGAVQAKSTYYSQNNNQNGTQNSNQNVNQNNTQNDYVIRRSSNEDTFAIISIAAAVAGVMFSSLAAIAGLVFGIMSYRAPNNSNLAKIGIGVSIAAIILRVIVGLIIFFVGIGFFTNWFFK